MSYVVYNSSTIVVHLHGDKRVDYLPYSRHKNHDVLATDEIKDLIACTKIVY